MISHLSDSSQKLLLDLFNRVFRNSTVSSTCKEFLIIPNLKPGKDPSIPGNYRPFSLTCCICKMIEKMVNFRLTWVPEKEKVLTPYQYGFRKLRSTINALVMVEPTIQNSLTKRRHMLTVLL